MPLPPLPPPPLDPPLLGYILKPFGGRVEAMHALATHGPRGYFYALVMQLPISDLGSTVEVTIRSVFGGLRS